MKKVLLVLGLGLAIMSCSKEQIDTTAPVITLKGGSPTAERKGNIYRDEGAIAIDNVDGDLSSYITVTNLVNTSILGTYNVIYRVTDNAGNVSEATRVVHVFN